MKNEDRILISKEKLSEVGRKFYLLDTNKNKT